MRKIETIAFYLTVTDGFRETSSRTRRPSILSGHSFHYCNNVYSNCKQALEMERRIKIWRLTVRNVVLSWNLSVNIMFSNCKEPLPYYIVYSEELGFKNCEIVGSDGFQSTIHALTNASAIEVLAFWYFGVSWHRPQTTDHNRRTQNENPHAKTDTQDDLRKRPSMRLRIALFVLNNESHSFVSPVWLLCSCFRWLCVLSVAGPACDFRTSWTKPFTALQDTSRRRIRSCFQSRSILGEWETKPRVIDREE